jgi:hypothetical protein
MKRLRRCRAAAIVPGLIMLSGMLGAPDLATAGKKGGSDGQAATCEYLRSIITYPYFSPAVQAWAISLYNSQGCPALQ